ncbi:MAG: branched-chain amino acid dehydrogenase [Firmicutes bacterium]|nr:branched-chain amino acid dehydrogenase [Bacillota bacterium]
MNKFFSPREVVTKFADGQTIMIGGFANTGVPDELIDLVVKSGVKHLAIIANDTGNTGAGVGKLVTSRQADNFTCSHVGMNPAVGQLMAAGNLMVELIPQGSLVEKIRCGGAGLGGVLVQTGLGTSYEWGKEKITVNGKSYILEQPLYADIALVKAWKTDLFGNLAYRGTARNLNPLVATAAKLVIVEAEEIVPVGAIDPNEVVTPGVFVNMILER